MSDPKLLVKNTSTARAVWLVPVIVFWLVLGCELVASLALNDGALYFSLDDPYIHMALAENLLGGHFGLNAGEACAPSSSILWPFLLVPLSALPGVSWAILLVNAICASLTLWLVVRTLGLIFEPAGDVRLQGAIGILGVLVIPGFNLVGLAFTGMEHSLQVLFAAALVHGTLRYVRFECVSRLLLIAIILGPLVRYENGALSAAALALLFLRGERRTAILSAGALVVLLGAYSAYLNSLGLGALPSSVVVKSAVGSSGGSLKPILYALYHNVSSTPGVLMSLAVIALLGSALSARRSTADRQLALCFACGLGLHLLVGRFGWYSRYEIYAWSACWLVCAYTWRESIGRWLRREHLGRLAILGLLVVGIACREYVIGLANNAFATHNVYLQQVQLGRFAKEFHKRPVAVNDLGQVALANDQYVLDLWGLASMEAQESRALGQGSGWMGPLAEQHEVEVAMIYDKWFEDLPTAWVRLGELQMAGMRVTPADSVVAFYATSEEHVATLREELGGFKATLPEGASFVFER